LRLCLVKLAFALSWIIPPSLGYGLTAYLGDLACLLAASARRAVKSNLKQVLGADSPVTTGLVRAVFRSGARNYYETLRVPHLSTRQLEERLTMSGWEHLDAALQAGRGAILVSAHLSGVVLGSQIITARGYPVVSIMEPVRPPALFALLARARAHGGIRLLPLSGDSTRELLAALRRNEVVALVADRDIGHSCVDVPFFGRPARVPAGPALLSLRTGAPLLVGATAHQGQGRYCGVIEPPLAIQHAGNLHTDLVALTRRMVERFEYHIGRNPAEWTVFQPIWRD
jgi:KDO2-lipid IV(A) lauroyltransferase